MTAPVTVTPLLPCPFCGGDGEIYEWADLGSFTSGNEPDPTSYHIACVDCSGGHPPVYDRAEAIAAWNTRTAAEAEAVAREAWQPIETAPKEIEGALYATPRLLLFFPRYGVFTGCWCRDPDYPWSGKWSTPGLLNKEARPTHWMECPIWPEGAHTARAKSASEAKGVCPSCKGLNTSCPEGCGRDPETGELNGTRL